MKKYFCIMAALFFMFGSAACGNNTSDTKEQHDASSTDSKTTAETAPAKAVELIVFAAASMTEALEEISKMYTALRPNVTLTFNFDSSGTLKTQIEEGASCDLFISAGQLQMDQLDRNADTAVNTDGLDFVMADTRLNLLENKVTLVIPEENPKAIKNFDDWAIKLNSGKILMAMGNSDVPVGQYTQKVLTYFNLNEQELAANGAISYGTNVKEVTTQVSEASVDCGIVYATDACSGGLEVIDSAAEEMCGKVIYPAAVINGSKHADEANAFLDYISGDEAREVFKKVGFSKL
jgi:molybdate transport system substrate-binding protein